MAMERLGGMVSDQMVDEPSEFLLRKSWNDLADQVYDVRPNHMITGSKLTGDSVIKNLYSESCLGRQHCWPDSNGLFRHSPERSDACKQQTKRRIKVTRAKEVHMTGLLHLRRFRSYYARYPH